jgi:di/tricarboxylate transporter
MTTEQALAFAILGFAMALFVWNRLRYDVVALTALLAAVATGVVPAKKAFSGFSDQIVIIVASALVVSAAISRSGIVESLIRPLAPWMRTTGSQIAVLVACVTVLSAFMKNIGAVAIFMPVAVQLARRTGTNPSHLLMPLAFGSLVGGLMTLIGTSPNVIVSRMREEIVGAPFGMFDFTPVGAAIALCGVVFLAFGWRLLPTRHARTAPEDLFTIEGYTTEAHVPAGSPMIGKTVGDVEKLAQGDVTVSGIIREKYRRYTPASHWTVFEGDLLVLEGEGHALDKLINDAKLELAPSKELEEERKEELEEKEEENKEKSKPERPEETALMEAVITADSEMVGRSLTELRLRQRHGVNLLALSRRGERSTARLRRMRFEAGDVVVLQGPEASMPDALAALGLLPLAERNVQHGRPRQRWLPIIVLAAAMALVTVGLAPVEVAFFGAATVIVLAGALTPNQAIAAVEWPVILLLGALIPVSDAIQETGGSQLMADALGVAIDQLPTWGAIALVMVSAMAVTPFLNNAATVLVMAPVAALLAQRIGASVDAFLMAVAIGAACDFLTPIGHQCNTLVMGPGGYRFGDYWRLGLPLSVLVVLLGTPLLMLVWPG